MSEYRIVAATERGIVTLEHTPDGWSETGREWLRNPMTCVAASQRALLAGSRNGIYRSADRGRTWLPSNEGMGERHVRWLAFHPVDPALAFAGLEPAAIFVSRDAGGSWRECPDVALLRDRHRWSLPYSPEAGCIRGFAFDGTTCYAAAEVGGVLRSDDWGVTWDLVPGSKHTAGSNDRVHDDVHSVTIGQQGADHIYAATGGGLYFSTDGGVRWDCLYRTYCRAVWVDPAAPGHLILGPANSVDRGGRIERSLDGGEDWLPHMDGAGEGVDASGVWPRTMVERFFAHGRDLFALLSDGGLLVTRPSVESPDASWHPVVPALMDVRAITFLDT